MAIADHKVKAEDFDRKDIMSMPDKPSEAGMNAATIKEQFDAGTKKVLSPKVNALIDELTSTEGAGNIGAEQIEGLSGYTVQDILEAMKVLLDTKQSIEQSDIDIDKKFDKTEAQSLVKSIGFTDTTGVFVITKQYGTTTTIDTAMEKVALNVRLDSQQFVLTLVDGTEQRVDLSAFLKQTEIKDSTTIALAEESGVLVAKLLAAAVKREHLHSEVTEYLEAKENAAAASASEAGVQAGNALASANAAAASQQSAKGCADDACRCASNAEITEQEVLQLKNDATGEVTKATAQAVAAAGSAAEAALSAIRAADEAKRAKEEADRAESIAGGDVMTRVVYDQTGKNQDVFAYADGAVSKLKKELSPEIETLKQQMDNLYFSVEDGVLTITYDDGSGE